MELTFFAGTLAGCEFANVTKSTVSVAIALATFGEAVVSIAAKGATPLGVTHSGRSLHLPALVTVGFLVVLAALANSRTGETIARREAWFALARLADVNGVNGFTVRSVEAVLALVTIDTRRVVLTVGAHATAQLLAVNIRTQGLPGNVRIVVALFTVSGVISWVISRRVR